MASSTAEWSVASSRKSKGKNGSGKPAAAPAAPAKVTLQIPQGKIGGLFGVRGVNIKRISRECDNARIVVDDVIKEGMQLCTITGTGAYEAAHQIRLITNLIWQPLEGPLIVDGSMLLPYAFPKDELWNVEAAHARIERLAEYALVHDVRVVFDGYRGAVNRREWVARRQDEITDEKRAYPPAGQFLLATMLKRVGMSFSFCTSHDLGDAIAHVANAHGGNILSLDRTLLAYQEATFTVFSEFRLGEGSVVECSPHYMYGMPMQDALRDLPTVPPTLLADDTPAPFPLEYWAGVPSPLVRQVGRNPYEVARPLRQALYHRMERAQTTEHIPVWHSNSCFAVMSRTTVPSDPAHLSLLKEPSWQAAFEHFFPKEAVVRPHCKFDWAQHVIGCQLVVAEIWCAANGVDYFL